LALHILKLLYCYDLKQGSQTQFHTRGPHYNKKGLAGRNMRLKVPLY